MIKFTTINYLILVIIVCICAKNFVSTSSNSNTDNFVYEMDDRIIEYSSQGKWLVIFYAPWCGHCRKLESILEDIGKHYRDKMVNVAKVDATRFIRAANHFEVRGYPTIKFINGNTKLNFNGERTIDDIIQFVERADAPRVNRLTSSADFELNKEKVKLFFLLVAKLDTEEQSTIVREYFDLANRYFLDAYFYSAHPHYLNNTMIIEKTPRIAVVKEKEIIFHDPNQQSLEEFIRMEQFLTFTPITLTNFHNLMSTRKNLMILLLNTKDDLKASQTRKIRNQFKTYSKLNRVAYSKKFHFGYTENHDLLNGIAIWTLSCPILFVLNSTNYEYSLVDLIDYNNNNTVLDVDIDQVLADVNSGNLTVFGGQSWYRTIRRPLWEMYRAIIEMFIEAPFISLLIFGFPFSVISIVFYFLCCLDSNDEPNENDGEGSDSSDEDEFIDQQQLQNEISDEQQQCLTNETSNTIPDETVKKTQ